MPTSHDDPRFLEALEQLGREELAQAAALLASLSEEASAPPATRLASLLCHALQEDWPAVEKAASDWNGGPLRTTEALRALALAKREPSEEALRLALESAWLPARPVPQPGDGALWRLWTLWDGPLASRLLQVRRAPEATSQGPAGPPDAVGSAESPDGEEPPDPFLEALLALLDPVPRRSAARLGLAIDAGLDLGPARLALARLRRLAGDREGARVILRGISPDVLEAPWSKRLAVEQEACSRDAELGRATQVVLRLGDATRILRRERGLFLAMEAGSSPDRWVRLVEWEPLTVALGNLVNDHLAAGWTLADWTLDKGVDELTQRLDAALARGDFPQAITLGRRLMQRQPEDAALSAKVLAAAVGVRGPAGAIELSQRALLMGEETSATLRRHAVLLWGAGSVDECLGTLFYLEDHHGTGALSPASYALLAAGHVVPRFRPTIASHFLSAGLARFPAHPALLEMQARLQLFDGGPAAALDTLAPLLASPEPNASVLALGLEALLEEEAGSAEPFALRARALHPEDLPLEALAHEAAGRTGPALDAHRRAAEAAVGPIAALERLLVAMRGACRMSAFEDALGLARRTQTLLGDPDPRCLDAIYESLTALEPGEHRDDLAAMADETRQRARERALTSEDRLRAQLSAGFHLDPAVLEPMWGRWAPTAPTDPLPAASPEPTVALLPLATSTAGVVLFDVRALADRLAAPPWDWLRDPDLLAAEQRAGRLVIAPLSGDGLGWLRVSTQPPRPANRFRLGHEVVLQVPSGQVFAGPAEALLGTSEASISPLALAIELGGRLRLLPQGRYQVTVWHALPGPWPEGEIGADPADVVFQIGPGPGR